MWLHEHSSHLHLFVLIAWKPSVHLLCVNVMYISTWIFHSSIFFFFYFLALSSGTSNLWSVSFLPPSLPPHDPRLSVPERGCGVWGESRVMEANCSHNWNGNFMIREDDLCSGRNPRPHWIINMGKSLPSNTIWCIFIGQFTPAASSPSSSSSSPPLFFSTSLGLGSDMLSGKIIFLHPECAELDKDLCAERHGNLRYIW